MSDDERWTVPGGNHQPPDRAIGRGSIPGGAGRFDSFAFGHWGMRRIDWRGCTVLCFNVTGVDSRGVLPAITSHTLAVELPVACPRLSFDRATQMASIRRRLGLGGARRGYDGFDRRFVVESDDEGFAREILTMDTMAWLAEHPVAIANPFRFDGGLLLMNNVGVMGSLRASGPKFDFLVDLRRRMPARYRGTDT